MNDINKFFDELATIMHTCYALRDLSGAFYDIGNDTAGHKLSMMADDVETGSAEMRRAYANLIGG